MDPSQSALDSVGAGDDDVVTPARLVFDTDTDCRPSSALGPCALELVDGVAVTACVCRVHSLRVAGELDVVGGAPLIVLAAERVDVDGTLDVSAHGSDPGPGGDVGLAPLALDRVGGDGGTLGSVGGAGGGNPCRGCEAGPFACPDACAAYTPDDTGTIGPAPELLELRLR